MYTSKIRRFSPHEWHLYRDLRLRALADSPGAFGRTLTEEQGRSSAEWQRRLASAVSCSWDCPLVAEVDGEPIGIAWGRIESSSLHVASLYQMWVAPSYRGLGVGQMLLEAVIGWARDRNVCYLELGVTCGDSPAMRLYTQAGFEPIGEPQPMRPGSDRLGQRMRLNL